MIPIINNLLTVNEFSRPATPIKKVQAVVMHYVGNPNTLAISNRYYFESLKEGVVIGKDDKGEKVYRYASAHYIVGLKGEIICCIPENEIAYHVGSSKGYNQKTLELLNTTYPNNCTIGIEMCHPTWDGDFNLETLDSASKLCTEIYKRYQLDPTTRILRHFDVTGKNCPSFWVKNSNKFEEFKWSIKI
jgi:N-acetylmuramoyl-L-alanine amidase